EIRRLLTHFIQAEDTDAILLSGGTGLSPRDGTYEVVQSCLEKELTGFGELFRYLSYAEIGAAAMMSRATAGVARGTVIVSMPCCSGANSWAPVGTRNLSTPLWCWTRSHQSRPSPPTRVCTWPLVISLTMPRSPRSSMNAPPVSSTSLRW